MEPRQGQSIDPQDLLDALRGRVPDWWLPDQVVQIAIMPLATTGKIDKNRLRVDYASQEAGDGWSSP